MSTRPTASGCGPRPAQQAVNEALRAIGALFEPGDVIEIRALDVDRKPDRGGVTYSGYFNFESRDAIDMGPKWSFLAAHVAGPAEA
jgi:hypothetical protein